MLANRRLNLLRRDVAASADDYLFLPSGEPVVAVYVAASQISGVKPAAARGRDRTVRILPITGRQMRTLDTDFSDLSWRYRSFFRIQQADANALARPADRPDPHAIRTVPGHGGDLGHAVHLTKRTAHYRLEGRLQRGWRRVTAAEISTARADIARRFHLGLNQGTDRRRQAAD